MSIQVLQKPSDIQPAQSPVVFSVIENSGAYTNNEFQYKAFLYVWDGNMNQSGSYIYQARKYPNASGSGIFDFSRMINSTLTDLSATNPSNIKYYKVEVGWQFANGSTYVTQSGGLTAITCSVGGTMFKAYDGYALFPDQINDSFYSQSAYYPFMTDMGSVTQSVQITDTSNLGLGVRGVGVWVGANDNYYPRVWTVEGIYENGATAGGTGANLNAFTGSTTSSAQIYQVAACPGDTGFPIALTSLSGSPLASYRVILYGTGSTTPTNALATLNYKIENECYYEPVRIAYKNRFGQFDFFNFYKRHNTQFNTDQRVYQPQLGTWQASTLSYNQYQTRQQRYIVDATEILECNTDFIAQGYNELFKQMLVSDEIYWLYDQANLITKPLSIRTNSLTFKTGVNNKLIQYTIAFDIGQPYKLIL
jgi:hypothetical protein